MKCLGDPCGFLSHLPPEICLYSHWFRRLYRVQTLHNCSVYMKIFICGMFSRSRIEGPEGPGKETLVPSPIQRGLLPSRVPFANLAVPQPPPSLMNISQLSDHIHMISFSTHSLYSRNFSSSTLSPRKKKQSLTFYLSMQRYQIVFTLPLCCPKALSLCH